MVHDETSEIYCKNGPSVLLVATGVKRDWWTPAGEESVPNAKFLFFPKLGCCGGGGVGNGNKKCLALFISYMRRPEHGAVSTCALVIGKKKTVLVVF
jgi:hypothetical protein